MAGSASIAAALPPSTDSYRPINRLVPAHRRTRIDPSTDSYRLIGELVSAYRPTRIRQWLHSNGHAEAARPYMVNARELSPEGWHYLRQTLELEEVGKASGPDFFGAVDALGNRPYYPPVEWKGSGK